MEHKITALKLQKKNKQRVSVYLDGEYAFGVARIVAAWLHVGQVISDEKISQLKVDDAREVAYQRALQILNIRPRSASEIRRKLNKHGTDEDIIEDVENRLQENGFIDDARFAQLWVENRSEFRPRGKRALSYELKQRGIDTQIINQALEDIDEDELAYRAARAHYHKVKNLEWKEYRKKMFGFLSRRGFSYGVCKPIVTLIWEEEHDQPAMEEGW